MTADALAPLSTKAHASTLMTRFMPRLYVYIYIYIDNATTIILN